MITEKRLEDAMDFLASTDDVYGALKADVAQSEYMAKVAHALIFKALDGSVADREAEAKTHETVRKEWRKHFEAISQFETLRARRERAILTVEVWRSMESTRRQGNLQ